MTSRNTYFACFENLNISKTKQDMEKLKTSLRIIWKSCFVTFKIRSTIFSFQWHVEDA